MNHSSLESSLSTSLKSEHKIDNFLVRGQGFSLQIRRIKRLQRLPLNEQLFAAIIKHDDVYIANLLAREDDKLIDSFIEFVTSNQFANVVLDSLGETSVGAILQHWTNKSAYAQLRAGIYKLAAAEIATHNKFDQRFELILRKLEDHAHRVMFIKGTHVCRTVYKEPHYRHYCDYDVVVQPDAVGPVLRTLAEAGFRVIEQPAFSNQTGVGPLSVAEDFFLAPCPGLIPASALTLMHQELGFLDMKIGPFDSGVQAHQFERMFSDARFHFVGDSRYLGPSLTDHLMIILFNLRKDRFENWKALLDVHMLVQKLNTEPGGWEKFVAACRMESIEDSAWMGLSIAVNRFGSPVPREVLQALYVNLRPLAPATSFISSHAFIWNSTSLPMLLFNALVSTNTKHKLSLLAKSIIPNRSFLMKYYRNREGTSRSLVTSLILHWGVLVLPGGLVRRTFGKYVFDAPK